MPLDKDSYHILIVEDDPDLTEMYKAKLETDGFKVSISTDGKAGLKAMRDLKPDLVLLDILIPKKDGFDVLVEKSKCKTPDIKNIPVIVLTNLSSPIDIEEGKRLGAKDWLVKAMNMPSEVSARVKEYLDGPKTMDINFHISDKAAIKK